MDTKITKENAREMQAKGVEKRKENIAKRKALREILYEELTKPAGEGSNLTKLEWLVLKAISNTKDDIELADLLKLQELLGEKQMTVAIEKRAPSEVAKDILNEIGE